MLFRLLISCLFLLVTSFSISAESKQAVVLTVDSAIGPAVADYVSRGISEARDVDASLVVLVLDTPGGLDKSMRSIVKSIIASPIPIITYVAPSGARAASAGTYILYASHVAAMAPGTNLGAATPVNMASPGDISSDEDAEKIEEVTDEQSGSAMQKKVINDSIAYIRSLAQLRQRNAQWAEEAVRSAESLPAAEAELKGVIDLVAEDINDLLSRVHQWTVEVQGKRVTLDTSDMVITRMDPGWRTRFLTVITSPDVAYILLLAGIYGIFFEFANPGFILPGVIGGICLLLALYAFQMLPISYAGLGLLVLGISFLTVEALIPSFGVLGIGGTIAFAIGSFMLFDTAVLGQTIAWPIILFFCLLNSLFFLVVITLAIRAYRRPVGTGTEELLGSTGEVISDFFGEGQIRIHSEIWAAKYDGHLKKGEMVQVVKVEGLSLVVQKVSQIKRG